MINKHRQRLEDSGRGTTYSFSETDGIVFAIQLKGIYWAGIPPPDPQEHHAANYYMEPRHFVQNEDSYRCVYNFHKPGELKNIINKFESGTFTKWKRFRGIGFEKKYSRAHRTIHDCDEYTVEKLTSVGNAMLTKLKTIRKGNQRIKTY